MTALQLRRELELVRELPGRFLICDAASAERAEAMLRDLRAKAAQPGPDQAGKA